jgi:mRNA-degrading endonuclease RelE of RelBE toxin-antitoxin system
VAYEVELTRDAERELRTLRAYDARRVSNGILTHLTQQPTVETRNRRELDPLVTGFGHVPPLWELRLGEYRVFYDVDDDTRRVFVRAIRRKEPHQTTEEITR